MLILQLAVRNVTRKRERSFLTTLGVLLAVGAFVSLLSLAEGLYVRVDREVNGRRVDLYVTPKDSLALPMGPIGTLGAGTEVISLDTLKTLGDGSQIPNVHQVAGLSRSIVNWEGQSLFLWGMDPSLRSQFLPGFQIVEGLDAQQDKNEMVVGWEVARRRGLSMGRSVSVGGTVFDVVGVFRVRGYQDYVAFVPLSSLLAAQKASGVQEVWLQLNDPRQAAVTMAALREKFPSLAARTREEFLGASHDYIQLAWLLQLAIACIGILIAVTAAMNTMLMSTFERMREFGTLRAIGASRLTVLGMILCESLILCMGGGILGIITGTMGSRLLDDAVGVLFRISFPLAVLNSSLILYALALSAAMGVVGAIIPAILVYRMHVIGALRWE